MVDATDREVAAGAAAAMEVVAVGAAATSEVRAAPATALARAVGEEPATLVVASHGRHLWSASRVRIQPSSEDQQSDPDDHERDHRHKELRLRLREWRVVTVLVRTPEDEVRQRVVV